MTDGLGFIYEDEGEADEATEDDLAYLKDPCNDLYTPVINLVFIYLGILERVFYVDISRRFLIF
jgi:hypothetical protein